MTSKIILLGLVAIAFVAGSIMTGTVVYGAKAPVITLNDIYVKVTDIQTKVNTLLTNVATLQTTSNDIKAKTDNLPSDPASNSHIDTAIASIPSGGLTEAQFLTLKCNSPIKRNVDFSGCDFINANFINAVITDADFSNANLAGAVFINANLGNTNFSGANLTGASFSGAILQNADFTDSLLTDTIFTGCQGLPFGTPASGTLSVCTGGPP